MRFKKILITSGALMCASAIPLALLTSCSTAWGNKTPIAIGDMEKDNRNNPYYNFYTIGSDINRFKDADGLSILQYLQSNYSIDSARNANYAYSTPVKKWFDEETKTKLPVNQWVYGSPIWAKSQAVEFTKAFEDKDKKAQICSQNITLASNIDFVTTLSNMMNQFFTGALQYQNSQMADEDDFAYSWGRVSDEQDKSKWSFILDHGNKNGSLQEKEQNRAFYEFIFSFANAHAFKSTDVMLKESNTNFNFLSFPIPSYSIGNDGKVTNISDYTFKLIKGSSYNNDYCYESTTGKDGDLDFTTRTFRSVPILVQPTNIIYTYLNPSPDSKKYPEKANSFKVTDYYNFQNQQVVKNAIGTAWQGEKQMPYYTDKKPSECYPTIQAFDIEIPRLGDSISLSKECKDLRINKNLLRGNQFIALVTYSTKEYPEGSSSKNTVTLGGIETIFPTYFLDLYDDLYKKAGKEPKDTNPDIFDVEKIDKHNADLINLIKRIEGAPGTESQGRVTHAKDLNIESKKLLQFLPYMLLTASDGRNVDTNHWLEVNKW